ncbi:MAG: ComF family protein [Actinomycetota bacterium]
MSLLASISALSLPARCAACNAWGRAALCVACERCVRWIGNDACAKCGRPSDAPVPRCRDCGDRDLAFDRARAAASYEGPARDALKSFKLRGERRTARELARWMVPPALSLGGADVLTWVPSTRRSEAERGFNPAQELARRLSRSLALPAMRLLRKTRETADQAGLTKKERRANLRGAVAATRRVPERVLLVDDVMTTGATVDECAIALKQSGAKRVTVVTFARAP